MVEKNDFDSYFFNDLYDDSLIGEKLSDFQNRLYHNILNGKGFIQNNNIINGDTHNIKINQRLNLDYGFSMSTYSLHFKVNILPYYSERAFVTKYGYGKPISSNDIMKDSVVFNKSFYFFINGNYIHDVSIVIKKNESILFITPTSDDTQSNICKKDIDEIIASQKDDHMWTIVLGTKADFYTAFLTRSQLFTDNKIYISKLNEYKVYKKPTKNNCWTLYLTSSNLSYNIMETTSVALYSDSNGEYFLVPTEFKNYIYAKATTFRCLIVNEPECSGSGVYMNVDGVSPIFQIPFVKNPIPKRNLIVWAYDSTYKRKLHPLEVNADLYYPNIYDFSAMLDIAYYQLLYTKEKEIVVGSDDDPIILAIDHSVTKQYDLYLEWIEPMSDTSAFDSYIQDYMDCYPDTYATMMVSKTLPDDIQNYHPIVDPKFGAYDYFNSEYKGDYRAWRLSNFIQLLQDNPKRYDELFHMLYYGAKKYITRAYNAETEPHIYERSIKDIKDHCNNANDYRIIFDIAQAYIHFYDPLEEEMPVDLYLNGILTTPTHIMKYGTTHYIYFETTKIANKETIQMDMDLINNEVVSGTVSFTGINYTYTSEDLELLGLSRKTSLSDIVYYIPSTGAYISNDNFAMEAQISVADIQYIGTDKVDTVSEFADEVTLYDKSKELVVPTDDDYIILRVTRVNHEITDLDSTKEIVLNNVELSLSDKGVQNYLNTSIGIATTDFYNKEVLTVKSSDLSSGTYTYTYANFIGKPTKDRFRIFNNGLRVSPSNINITFNGYNKNAVIKISNVKVGELIIQYIGYDEITLYDSTVRGLKQTSDEIFYLADILDTPFDTLAYKVYIDGYRVSNDQIKTVGQGNMIMIQIDNYSYSNTSNIVIYKQKHDIDLYDFDINSQFLDKIAVTDSTFRKYLINKYK